jgi:hypothetical protein
VACLSPCGVESLIENHGCDILRRDEVRCRGSFRPRVRLSSLSVAAWRLNVLCEEEGLECREWYRQALRMQVVPWPAEFQISSDRADMTIEYLEFVGI